MCISSMLGRPLGGSMHWLGHNGTPLFLSSRLRSFSRVCLAGCVCPVLQALAAGLRLPGESMGRVTCGFLQSTTELQQGARGVWYVVLLGRPGGSQVALYRVLDWVEVDGRSWGGLSTTLRQEGSWNWTSH